MEEMNASHDQFLLFAIKLEKDRLRSEAQLFRDSKAY